MSNTTSTVNLEMPVDSFNDELLPVNPMAKRPAALDGKTVYTVIDGTLRTYIVEKQLSPTVVKVKMVDPPHPTNPDQLFVHYRKDFSLKIIDAWNKADNKYSNFSRYGNGDPKWKEYQKKAHSEYMTLRKEKEKIQRDKWLAAEAASRARERAKIIKEKQAMAAAIKASREALKNKAAKKKKTTKKTTKTKAKITKLSNQIQPSSEFMDITEYIHDELSSSTI